MTKRSVDQLADDIHTVLDRHRMESVMTYAEMIGVLEMVKMDIMKESLELLSDGEQWE